MKKILCITGMVLGLSTVGFSQSAGRQQSLDTVYLDSKTPLVSANSGKIISSITAEQIALEPNSSVAQLLNRISGIEINGSRSNGGQNLGYFVRGGRNRQVVVLIDGVQVNDPSQIANDFDLRLLPASGFEKIEVLKGASSVLYGSGAATAVISLTSKKNSDKVFGLQASTSLATENSSERSGFGVQAFNNSARMGGTYKGWSYQMQLGHQSRTGLSAVATPEGEPAFSNDPFNSYSATASIGYDFKNGLRISRSFSQARFKAAFDNFDYTDANNLSTTELQQLRGNLTYRYQKGRVVVNDAYSWTDRDIASSFPSRFDSRFFAVDAYWNHQWNKQFSTVVGVNGQFSDFNSFSIPFGASEFNQDIDDQTADFDIIDPYLNVVYQSDFGLNLNAGVRLNTHSNYDNAVVYHINPSFTKKLGDLDAKVLASYSTAYITPSLFQLFDPNYGNLELNPENNRTIEAGLAVGKTDSFNLSVVYFNRLEEDFIDFVTVDPDLFIFQYQNITEDFSASGIEVEGQFQTGKVRFNVNYTYTKPDERFSLRIPEHKLNASLNVQWTQKFNCGLQYQYNAAREDAFFNSLSFENEAVTLDAFGILDWYGQFRLNDAIGFTARVNNLLNQEYEELFRFQTLGRNYSLGMNINL